MKLRQLKHAFLGDDPRALALLLVPTALAVLLDLGLRGRLLAGYALQGKAIYLSSLLISAGFWVLPLWFAGWMRARSGRVARVGFALFFAVWVLPLVTFSYGGQALYHRVVHAYMGRDTVRLGFALRGMVGDWFVSWGSPLALVGMIASGVVITIAIVMALYHLHSLFDEEVRVPGFVIAGSRAMTDEQKAALRTFAGKRTYFADVFATVVDLFGLGAERAALPFGNPNARSLIDKRGWTGDSVVLLSTATAVWAEDDVRYGIMRGEKLLSGAPGATWTCFDSARDPLQQLGLPPEKCGPRMMDIAENLPR